MTPKEKAKELIDKFSNHCFDFEKHKEDNEYSAKQCALIAINEMLDFRNSLYINENSLSHQYLIELKQEIENL